ncbi:phage regulatory CII family protein [Sulfurimonas sp. NWX79]|uniref:phage regulatory CII family protein n=1 Tax=Campylobacterales TaxID=213849 RepID=UPI00320499AF|nr:regulatory protein CII [Sulfurimonas phage SNW-1]
MALPKTPLFYKLIAQAIDSFGERHHVTARSYFAPLLGYKGDNAAIMLSTALNYTTYNPASPKPLNIDHLYVLLNELGEDRNIIIDGLLKEFDLVAIPKQKVKADVADINLLVDVANMENSDVFRVVKKAMSDGTIDEEERAEILKEIEEAQKANARLKDLVLHLATNKE